MALRDQPYFPLYVQDFMTDEALNECSAESTGVYIRIMCLMHKSKEYGTFSLKEKDKQNSSTCYDFATPLAKACYDFAEKLDNHLPYKVDVIAKALQELIENEVLVLDGDKILQRRMVRDFEKSTAKADAGRQGGLAKAEASKTPSKDPSTTLADTEYEYEYENIDKNESEEREGRLPYKEIIDYLNLKIGSSYRHTTDATRKAIHARFEEKYTLADFYKVIDVKSAEWTGNEKYEKFLRPETLFGNKFEGYLNQPTTIKPYEAKLIQSSTGGGFQM